MNPIDFGADPFGNVDSTDAVNAALSAALNATGHAYREMASGIRDLGGATLDLHGGTYLISSQLEIPMFVGNFHMKDGTLRASSAFNDTSAHLIKVGDVSCSPPGGQGSCNEFVSFTDMMFDANFNAAGGAQVQHVMGT